MLRTMPNQPQMFLVLYFAPNFSVFLHKVVQNITQIKAFSVPMLIALILPSSVQAGSSVQVQLTTEISLIITVRPTHPTPPGQVYLSHCCYLGRLLDC